ncbi:MULTISPECIES: transglycosylase family protein [unclassified Streptomyces]|uniref:LysM peptidoglycan-binding domain-containing protein n=1 Tax=unclassified Streptomyces TaxID=2593676 RepID=UPI00093DE53C|nr:transglycosylase family protein [Streptomyces sp. TSRI0281]OKI34940.1 transglycosylase domain-containing protein [Streptomyces sp. TSRI0281]
MGSANGRHRRPRQAPAIVVAAGVTGSAIAIPLLGATGAHAADASTWDRVAECESGGMWSADLGNGFYGGLQFSQDTWSAYGGTAFAARADLASRSQQISVAEKVLDDQGPKAWPSCAVISGLAVDGALPGVDPGGTPSADPSDTATPSADGSADGDKGDAAGEADAGDAPGEAADPSTTPSTPDGTPSPTKPKGSAKPEDSSAPEDSAAPDASKDTDRNGGKHRGTPAPEGSRAADGDDGRESGRHASRGDGEARDGGAERAGSDYTVRPGDSLWAIADAQKLSGGWAALYEANKDALGSDPDLILPGQNLDLDLGKRPEDAAVN